MKPKARRRLNWLLFAGVLTILAELALIRFHETDYVQLKKLEAHARAVPFSASGGRTTPSNSMYWGVEVLLWKAHVLGAQVAFGEPEPGALGTSMLGLVGVRVIMVDDRLHWNDRFDVLAHELAHYLSPDSTMEAGAKEVYCDAVAFLTARRLGYDTLDISAHHLAMYKDSLHAVDDYRAEIVWAADFLAR